MPQRKDMSQRRFQIFNNNNNINNDGNNNFQLCDFGCSLLNSFVPLSQAMFIEGFLDDWWISN